MTTRIITADERLAAPSAVKGVIFGPSGIGKTTLAKTMPAEDTLFIDLEAGMKAIEEWRGDSINVRDASLAMGKHGWDYARGLACVIGGPNPSAASDKPYSRAHYEWACANVLDPAQLAKYKTIMIDSITVAGRLCFSWCKTQPEAFSEKTGKPDQRGAYGLHGHELLAWLTQLQHTPGKNIWFLGILDKKVDDFNRVVWEPQIDGSKVGRELPGILDQVISMVELQTDDGEPYRAFVCHLLNKWGYPAKDRSGRLNMIEEPHLGKLMAKMNGARIDKFNTAIPSPSSNSNEKEVTNEWQR